MSQYKCTNMACRVGTFAVNPGDNSYCPMCKTGGMYLPDPSEKTKIEKVTDRIQVLRANYCNTEDDPDRMTVWIIEIMEELAGAIQEARMDALCTIKETRQHILKRTNSSHTQGEK